MAIYLLTGKPGSGKTYYAVDYFVKTYCELVGGQYQLKKGYYIITNIDNLLLPHVSLSDVMGELSVEMFFTVNIQQKLSSDHGSIIYLIDECQQFFHKKFYNKEVFFFLETHRHYGFDIFLITQSNLIIPKNIVELCEYEIRAQSRSISIVGELKYLYIVSGEIIDRKVLRRNKKIFDLYKSMNLKEKTHINNPFVKWFIFIVILFIASIWFFYTNLFGGVKDKVKNIDTHVNNISDKLSSNNILNKKNESIKGQPGLSAPVIDNKKCFNSVRLSCFDRSDGSRYCIDPLNDGLLFNVENSKYDLISYDLIVYASVPCNESPVAQRSETTNGQKGFPSYP